MKCEHCGKNEVTFVYRSSINGETTQTHLCSRCAQELGYTKALARGQERMMQSFFGRSLLEEFFSPMPSLLGRGGSLMEDPFDDLFSDMPVLRACGQKEPQTPQKQEALVNEEEQSRFSLLRQKNALRLEMKRAVREENFERAAELRDQIRQLEEQVPKGNNE